jgi:hypothetical protein
VTCVMPSELSELLARALRDLRFGSLEIVVHDGQVVHVERRERLRLKRTTDRPPESRTRMSNPPDRTHRTSGGHRSTDEESIA